MTFGDNRIKPKTVSVLSSICDYSILYDCLERAEYRVSSNHFCRVPVTRNLSLGLILLEGVRE